MNFLAENRRIWSFTWNWIENTLQAMQVHYLLPIQTENLLILIRLSKPFDAEDKSFSFICSNEMSILILC